MVTLEFDGGLLTDPSCTQLFTSGQVAAGAYGLRTSLLEPQTQNDWAGY